MRRELLMTIVFSFFITHLLTAQHIIKGVLKSGLELENGTAYIEVYDSTFTLVQSQTLEDKEKFLFTLDSTFVKGKILVYVLGCDLYAKEIQFLTTKNIFLPILLKNCIQELEEVIVKDSRSFQEEKGDTTIFDVDGFRRKTDITLGDILNKIPGLEITGENQILYKGRRIDKILVEGRDILNDQHKLALQGLKAEDIKNIEIIQQYRPFSKMFSKDYTDQVAMNVQLTDDAKNKINGDYELLGGVKKNYLADAELIVVRKSEGNATFLRSNNSGEDAFSTTDFMGLHAGLSRLTQGKSGRVEILPSVLLPSPNTTQLTQHFISSSSDFDISKDTRGKLSVMGIGINRSSESIVSSLYFDANSMFNGRKEHQSKMPYLYLLANIKHKMGKRTRLELDVPFSTYLSKENTKKYGDWDNIDYNSKVKMSDKNRQISPQLRLSHKHNDEWSSIHTFTGEIDVKNKNIDFLESIDLLDSVNQTRQWIRKAIGLKSTFEYSSKTLRIKLKNELLQSRLQSNIDMERLPFEGKQEAGYLHREWKPSVRFGIQTKHWMAHTEVVVPSYSFQHDNTSIQDTKINPIFRVKYSWSKFQFIGFSLNRNITPIDQTKTFGMYFLEDNQHIRYEDISPNVLSKSNAGSLYYIAINSAKKQTFINHFQYLDQENGLSYLSRREGKFIINEVFLADRIKSIMTSSTLRTRFFHKDFVLTTGWNLRYTQTQRSAKSDIMAFNMSLNAMVSTKFDSKWNGSLGANYSILNQKINNINQDFQSIKPKLKIRFVDYKWRGNLSYAYQWNDSSSGQNRQIHLLDFWVDYMLNKNLSFKIKAIDLLNLGESRTLMANFTDISIETQNFRRLSGVLMFGIVGRF